MGSIFKRIKKTFKKVTKPLSKMTKGIARGIAKVGKAVMKGVGKISNKFGPLGSIALAIAMPYAMQGLGAGWTKMAGMNNPFGTFLKSVSKMSSNGFNRATGFIKDGFNGITKRMMDTFSAVSNRASQSNIWKSISNGAKRLYTNAKKYTPKFRAGKAGTVDVGNWGGHPLYGGGSQTMTTTQAQGLLQSGAIDASQLSNQTLGSAEGWFTKAGSSEADKLVTETINSAMKDNVNLLQGNSKTYFDDLIMHQKDKGIYINDAEAFDTVINSKGTTKNFATDFSTTPDSYSTNLAQTGDYTLGTARDKAAGTYNFTGGETYNNPLGKKYINKKTVSSAKKAMFGLGDSLLAGNPHRDLPDPVYAVQNDMTMNTQTGNYSGTNLKGAYGTDYFNAVFGNAAWEKLKNNYKYMNIT